MMIETKTCEGCKKPRRIPSNRTKCSGCREFDAKVKDGRIKPPDYKEVNTAAYKEPMQKVEDGFGYYGAVTETNDGTGIQCHICGYYYGSLGAHIRNKHGVDPRDYKIKYGLRVKEGLQSTLHREAAQLRYNKYARKSPEEFKEMALKGAESRKKAMAEGRVHRGDWTAQQRNETGTCKEQTLAKIRHIAEMSNNVPTYKDYVDMFGSMDVVKHWFGSWDKAVEAAGLESYLSQRKRERKSRMKDALSMMQAFYAEFGRTPSTADFNTDKMLPSQRQISRDFGTLNNARKQAGLPTVDYIRGQWIEVMPSGELGIVIARGHNRFADAR